MQTNSNVKNGGKPTFQKSSVANLYFYAPTGVYYARPRIKGKVKSKCLRIYAVETFRSRLAASKNLKPRSKEYRMERFKALLDSWPNFESVDIGKIKKHDCQEWVKRFGKNSSATAFNNTVGTLRMGQTTKIS